MNKRYYENAWKCLAWISSIVFLILSACLLWFLVRKGCVSFYKLLSNFKITDTFPYIHRVPILRKLIPAVFGTLLVIFVTLLIATPLGISMGVWMHQFAKPKTKKMMDLVLQLLSSIPSIVLGFAGYFGILFLRQNLHLEARPCLLLSALCLSLLVLPILVRSTETALSQIPVSIQFTGLSLGMTRLQNAIYILLPEARKGLARGVFLASSRIAEDTAIIMLTGAVADAIFPQSLKDPFSSLSLQILFGITESRGPQDQMIVHATTLTFMMLTFTLSFLGEKLLGGKRV